MVCSKCKKEVTGNRTICLYCGSVIKENKAKPSSSSKASKVVRNKYISDDQSALVGSEVTKKDGSFIKLQRKPKKDVFIERKNYVNYIDYKEAKDEQNNKRYIGESKSVLGKFFNVNKDVKPEDSGMVSLERANKISKSGLNELKSKNISDGISTGSKVSKSSRNKLAQRLGEPLVDAKATSKNTSSGIIELRPIPPREDTFRSPKIITIDNNRTINNMERQEKVINLSFLPYVLLAVLWIGIIGFIITSNDNDYYFSENDNRIARETIDDGEISEEMTNYEGVSKSGQNGGSSSEGVTSIVYDNQYLEQFTIKDLDDVVNLIKSDSLKQKSVCPSNIIAIENEIINTYGITAVNLCEMDYDFANELKSVIKYVYDNYPSARNYLTNLTLANVDKNMSFIAAFMPIFTFATSNTSTGYPVAIKTQILLNAKYFLNTSKINNSVSYGASSGYFPPNATRSSTVAHEFGHYLSYVALLNYYNSGKLNFVKASRVSTLYDVYDDFNAGDFSKILLEEAYEEYKKTYNSRESFNEFRETISQYAVSKDSSGKYIYDETIAEAFHDCYLNGNSAKPASKIIMKILNQYL